MSKKISFVIPHINEYPAIYHTINNIQTEMKDSPYNWEIIAVENGNVNKNTAHAFTGRRPLYRTLIGRKKVIYDFEPNQCGPVARNLGAFKHATGDYVIFMDAHTNLGKDSIEPLADYLGDHIECGCIQGLTAWSHYDFMRMGFYYELFHTESKQELAQGGPSLPTHMHGHYMAPGHIKNQDLRKRVIKDRLPTPVIMGSQAYTMYRLDEFKHIGGYYDECRFYPHPEGLLPLKVWMTGKEVVSHPQSWHLHSMYPRDYAVTKEKLDAYGGHSQHYHRFRNTLMVAYILGGQKWLDLCWDYGQRKYGGKQDVAIYDSAKETVETEGAHDRLMDMAEMSLDDVLIMGRREKILGMEKWFKGIGDDPK